MTTQSKYLKSVIADLYAESKKTKYPAIEVIEEPETEDERRERVNFHLRVHSAEHLRCEVMLTDPHDTTGEDAFPCNSTYNVRECGDIRMCEACRKAAVQS